MKHIKTLLLATALCIGTVSFTQAQSKVAHINTQELIKAMPEMKTAQSELEALGKTYKTDMQGSYTEFQNLQKEYEADAKNQTDAKNQERILELQEKQQRLQQFQADAQKDMQEKEIALLEPITEKAKAAILKVSRAQGFDYVLDSGTGITILTDGKDLLNDVKKELGI
ncbi:OmpH family outer membrane protein [Algibacter miyuki]|uniref:OmpH family outer membrane protein n=1 Tax=Algibacter miyuki TaxID=1306933 RepID=A0ABV5H277_9FLAO|nr:OmpH family outer membrane protein [Algibacter miyuki]MDN3666196.1 OmpH family outer membrane protein [Algibacter miyuki]